MHDVYVRMKDGRSFSGPMGVWRPAEGWFELMGGDARTQLEDCREATSIDRTHVASPNCTRCSPVCEGLGRIDWLRRWRDDVPARACSQCKKSLAPGDIGCATCR